MLVSALSVDKPLGLSQFTLKPTGTGHNLRLMVQFLERKIYGLRLYKHVGYIPFSISLFRKVIFDLTSIFTWCRNVQAHALINAVQFVSEKRPCPLKLPNFLRFGAQNYLLLWHEIVVFSLDCIHIYFVCYLLVVIIDFFSCETWPHLFPNRLEVE